MTAEEPPISLVCNCGHAFRVRGRAAGRVVKCPACSAGVKVPEAEPVADAFNVVDDAPSFAAVDVAPAFPVASVNKATPPNLPKDSTKGTPSPRSTSPTLAFRVGRVVRRLTGGTGKREPDAESISLPASRSYLALRIVAFVVGATGYLQIAFAMLFTFVALVYASRSDAGERELELWITSSLPTGFSLFIVGILLVAASELIVLAIHVAASMLATANAVRQQ